jgi:hypothetical protein
MSPRGGAAVTDVIIGVVVLAALAVAIIAVTSMDPPGERGQGTGRRYADAVRSTATIDASKITWTESAQPVPVDMKFPRGLALGAEDRILVIGDRLVIMAADGTSVVRSGELEEYYQAITVDPQGLIHVTAESSVDTFDVSGPEPRIVATRKITETGVELTSIALTPEGMFLADSTGCRVFRMPLAAAKASEGQPGYEIFVKGFHVPSVMDLASSPDGDLVTVDPGRHRVQLRDVYGDVVSAFGKAGDALEDFHGCCNPAAIAIMKDGHTVTAEKGLAATRIKVYDKQGQLESVVAGPDSFDHRPDGPAIILDVAVDSKGRVLVLDPARRQVRIFSRKKGAKKNGEGK